MERAGRTTELMVAAKLAAAGSVIEEILIVLGDLGRAGSVGGDT